MPPLREQSPRRIAGRAVVAIVVVMAAIPLYLSLDTSWRPLVIRLGCAALVGVASLRLLRHVGRALELPTVTPFEAPRPAPVQPELDSRFLRLRDELIFSTRSRRYFDAILWPRLRGLAGADLPQPADRRGWPRRGPSLTVLADLIARIESGA